jgi:hypothetical protein
MIDIKTTAVQWGRLVLAALLLSLSVTFAYADLAPGEEASLNLDQTFADLRDRFSDGGMLEPWEWDDRHPVLRGTNGFTLSTNPAPGWNNHSYEVNGQKFDITDPAGLDQLTALQKSVVYAYCQDRDQNSIDGLFTPTLGEANCDAVSVSEDTVRDGTTEIETHAYESEGGRALKLFRYAMGQHEGAEHQCISCTFLDSFLTALSGFSASTYLFLKGVFVVFVPMFIAIWIAWKTAALFVMGGEDGRSYIYSILGRLALFFFLWGVFSTGEETVTHYGGKYTYLAPGWEITGPTYLNFAFGLSNAIRGAAFDSDTSIASNFDPGNHVNAFQCNYAATTMWTKENLPQISEFKAHALNVACATERSHMVGIATGFALVGAAQEAIDLDKDAIGTAILGFISGVFMMVIFGLSAIWFIFLILDVAVRGLITAAFAPIIAALALFQPTRYIAISAIKSMGGAIMSAIGIGIIATLAFFLLTNTVNVYNDLFEAYKEVYGNTKLVEIPVENSIQAYELFLVRIQSSNADLPQIPMDLGAPWFYYLILSGLAIFSLGKKIIAMLENMIGINGMSSMADNAMKMSRTGATLGMQGATTIGVMSMATGKSLTGLLSQGGGAIRGGGGAAANIMRSANPFGGAADPSQAAKTMVESVSGGVEPDGAVE